MLGFVNQQPLKRMSLVYLTAAFVALPVLAYGLLLAIVSVNIPYLDDYDTVLRFLLEARAPDAAPLQLVLAQHAEHRLVLLRAVALAMVGVTGRVDFVAFAWLGFAGLLVLTLGLFAAWRTGENASARLLPFAPAVWFLFQPQFWDACFWATSALSNLWVLPLALTTLLVLRRETRIALLGAAALASLTTLTQGNGVLVLPAGLLLLGLQNRRAAAAAWAAGSALLVALYAIGFQPVEGVPSLLESARHTPTLIHYAFNFLGSAAGFSHPTASALFGACWVASATALALTRYPRQNPVLYGLLLILIASAFLNALGRAHISGADYPLTSVRYRFYASAVTALSYLCWVEWLGTAGPAFSLRLRQVVATGLAAGLTFGAASYLVYADKALTVSQQMSGGLAHWQRTGRGLRHHDQQHAGAILTKARQAGLYAPGYDENR